MPVVDYGNNIRQVAQDEGVKNAFDFPGFVPAYVRPQFCEGRGPFRWVALSGDPEDIRKTDAKIKELFPDEARVHRWLDMAGERIAFQGLPARICWLGLGPAPPRGPGLQRDGGQRRAEGPHRHRPRPPGLRLGGEPEPRDRKSMKDGSDAVSDWPLLNAMLNTAGGATWVSLHHGGGVGMGYSQHSGVVIVADGTPEAAERLQRVLWNDPGTGVMRHADAGYDIAKACAKAARPEPSLALMTMQTPLPATSTLPQLRVIPWRHVQAATLRRLVRRWTPAPQDSWPPRPRATPPVYGVNTGFGKLASTRIAKDQLAACS